MIFGDAKNHGVMPDILREIPYVKFLYARKTTANYFCHSNFCLLLKALNMPYNFDLPIAQKIAMDSCEKIDK